MGLLDMFQTIQQRLSLMPFEERLVLRDDMILALKAAKQKASANPTNLLWYELHQGDLSDEEFIDFLIGPAI